MAKSSKKASDSIPVAGFTVSEWKHHMDHDEDWTERLEGANEGVVSEVVAALEHDEGAVRALACNLAYALGVSGLGQHADAAVERLAALAEGDKAKKVRTRAALVHESLAGELQRAAIRRELDWLGSSDPSAYPQAIAAISDPRDEVRLQTYVWWANAVGVPEEIARQAADALARQAQGENDDVRRRAAEIALGHLAG